MSELDKLRLKWSKSAKDWKVYYPDNDGKALMGVLLEMAKTTGHRTDWQKPLFVLLREYGYDPTTLKISCKKIQEKRVITLNNCPVNNHFKPK